MIKAGIIGANGYTGMELMRLLASHPSAKVVYAASRSKKGTAVSELYPALSGFYGDMLFDDVDLNKAAACDVVFSCLPHGASAGICKELFSRDVKIIDLSADFRYDDLELYESVYKVSHPAPEINKTAVYGLTEINREQIKTAKIVGNPGCYTTASIAALYPLVKNGLIDPCSVIIDAKSGVSGAGRKADEAYGFTELCENFSAYAVTTHRHTSEIEEKLTFSGDRVKLIFTPHLLPVKRGILATIYADIKTGGDAAKSAEKYYNEQYGGEQFIEVRHDGKMPTLKSVTGSNMIKIGYTVDKKTNRMIIVSVIDNLIKGASGQAIQNMNVMTGLPENAGLPKTAFHL